jgi:8-oxo-dGTP diphosphatase
MQISTLIYCFDPDDRVLLIQRNKSPNQGLWSPPGGKLIQNKGESPHQCAARESREELGLEPQPEDFHLTGVVSETAYEGKDHWLMFLFEYRHPMSYCPPPHPEGSFEFYSRPALEHLDLPATDKAFIWPMFWKYRNQFFTIHCHCSSSGAFDWQLLQGGSFNTKESHD